MTASLSTPLVHLPWNTLGWTLPSGWQWAWLALAVLVSLWVARRSYSRTVPALDPRRRILLTTLRASSLLLLIGLLLEPVLTSQRSRQIDPTVLLLIDDSASMSVTDVGGQSRFDAARATAVRMADRLEEQNPGLRVEVATGSQRLRLRSSSSARPKGEGTDLRSLLVSAEQRYLEDNLRAIVLFSDGRSTQGGSALRSVGAPVFAITMGDSAGATDLRLDRVRYPSLVRQGDRVRIDAELVSEAEQAGSSRIELRREGTVVDAIEVSWDRDTGRQPYQFVVTADSLGWQRYELAVVGIDGELIAANNAVQIAFEVQKDRLRVLFVEARPTWNAHFLRRVAQRDRRFDFGIAHLRETGMGVAFADTTMPWPLATDAWQTIDLFVTGSLDDYARLASSGPLVETVRAGAGLWVLAAGAAGTGVPTLDESTRALLPLRPRGRWRMTSGEFRPELTATGRRHDLLHFDSGMGDLEDRLAQLPPLALSLGPAEPSADAEVLLRARSGPWGQPLLALRPEGRGTVAMWGGAPLWTWSFWRLGETDNEDLFDALVENLMSQLSEGASRERLRLQLPGRVVAVGSDTRVRAVVLDPQFRPDDDSEVWLEYQPVDSLSAVQRLPMSLDPAAPGSRRLPLPSLPPGDYRLRAVVESTADRDPIRSDWAELSVDAYSVEFRNPRPDPASLRSLARASGGAVLQDSVDDRWTKRLELGPRQEVELSRLDLWSSWWALLPLLGLLTLEWSLRRRWGLL